MIICSTSFHEIKFPGMHLILCLHDTITHVHKTCLFVEEPLLVDDYLFVFF